ncbi:anti-repressor SinI family protein [Priestia aryabhattai]
MDSKEEVITPNVDQEWISLIQKAKEIGLSVKEVKAFLNSK